MRSRTVAESLDIPFHVVDLKEDFKRIVVDHFLDEYKHGRTPNPCVVCNRQIKFGKLLELADQYGCDMLATGHYARVVQEKIADGTSRFLLLEATDKEKDQSYYLHGLTQRQLQRIQFPLGAMQKDAVYSLAKRFGIPFDNETYRESQDLCFFPEKSPHAFLKRHLKETLQPGDIVQRDGNVIGRHEGLPLYTIGQRRGLHIGGLKIPLEVIAKDTKHNRLIVEEKDRAQSMHCNVTDLTWISWQPEEDCERTFECRTRSLSPKRKGIFVFKNGKGTFRYSEPAPLQSPGQYLVLYSREELIGGGVIE